LGLVSSFITLGKQSKNLFPVIVVFLLKKIKSPPFDYSKQLPLSLTAHAMLPGRRTRPFLEIAMEQQNENKVGTKES
jgi:hypothetical protein